MTHRWITSALFGQWCSSADEALFDALLSGQAVRDSGQNDEIVLRTFTAIEVRKPPVRVRASISAAWSGLSPPGFGSLAAQPR